MIRCLYIEKELTGSKGINMKRQFSERTVEFIQRGVRIRLLIRKSADNHNVARGVELREPTSHRVHP